LQVDCSTSGLKDSLSAYFHSFVTTETPSDPHLRITVHEGPAPTITEALTIKPPGPGKIKIKEEYLDLADGRIVRKRLTGMVLYFNKQDHLAIGPCQDHRNQVVNFINNRFI
jgi:HprK-related kinase B